MSDPGPAFLRRIPAAVAEVWADLASLAEEHGGAFAGQADALRGVIEPDACAKAWRDLSASLLVEFDESHAATVLHLLAQDVASLLFRVRSNDHSPWDAMRPSERKKIADNVAKGARLIEGALDRMGSGAFFDAWFRMQGRPAARLFRPSSDEYSIFDTPRKALGDLAKVAATWPDVIGRNIGRDDAARPARAFEGELVELCLSRIGKPNYEFVATLSDAAFRGPSDDPLSVAVVAKRANIKKTRRDGLNPAEALFGNGAKKRQRAK